MDSRIEFENALVHANVDALKNMVEKEELRVVRRHVKLAKKIQKMCATPENEQEYIKMIEYLKSKCKCKYFL